MTMLDITDLTLSTGSGGQRVDLLRSVSLSLARAKVLGLVGESGAGKSMIGRIIAGQTPAGFEVTRGRVSFDGMDLLSLDRSQHPLMPRIQAAAVRGAKKHSKKAKAAAAATPTPTAPSSLATAPEATPASTPAAKKHQAPEPQAAQAPGGGNGQVWVNSESHVYHKEGSKWYGRTKHGKYMSEADAVKEGDKPSKNEKQ